MRILSAILAFVLMSNNAIGVQIDYVFTGSASGNVNGVSFGNSAFTITALAETTSRAIVETNVLTVPSISSSIEIDGVGTFNVFSSTRTFRYLNSVGYSRPLPGGLDLYDLQNNSLVNWGMQSSFGPVTTTGHVLQWDSQPVQTSGGILVLNETFTGGTFQAVIVPEPSTLTLAALGIAATLAYRCRLTRSKR